MRKNYGDKNVSKIIKYNLEHQKGRIHSVDNKKKIQNKIRARNVNPRTISHCDHIFIKVNGIVLELSSFSIATFRIETGKKEPKDRNATFRIWY